MRASLESILADSLSGLKDLSAPVVPAGADIGPVEGLTVITADQVAADVLEHMKDERYKDEDNLSQTCRDFLEQNELEHAELRGQISEVREVVGGAMASMEMLATVASMESIDSTALNLANTAISNIASQYSDVPPVLVAEDGVITTASMEGLIDFVKRTLVAMKKWIAEKFENLAISNRRQIMSRAALVARAEAVQKRLNGLPSDYGIPAKQLRMNPKVLFSFYRDGHPIGFDANSMTAAYAEASEIMKFANENIYKDAVERSGAIGDVIADVLVARDDMAAETKLKELFKKIGTPLAVEGFLAPRRDREVTGGMTFLDPTRVYRSNYRDAEWIMEVVRQVEMNQVYLKYRQVGQVDQTVKDVPELQVMLDAVMNALDDDGLSNFDFYNELAMAWQDANKVYGRLVQMVQSMEFPHMNNELWRAMDVAVSSMFMFLDKGYYHTLHLRSPAYRFCDALLYILEEQLKAYVAVNRR